MRTNDCIIFSKTLETDGSIAIGLQLDMPYFGPDLCKGMTDAIFHDLGYRLVARMKLERRLNGVASDKEHDLSNWLGKLLKPLDFLEFRPVKRQ